MLMVFDDGVLKRYGLPKPMVERALIEVYETVVLGQQSYRNHFRWRCCCQSFTPKCNQSPRRGVAPASLRRRTRAWRRRRQVPYRR
jgi:hypothetical protein